MLIVWVLCCCCFALVHGDDTAEEFHICGTAYSEPPADHEESLAKFSKLSAFQPLTFNVVVHAAWSEGTRQISYISYDIMEEIFFNANKVLAGTSIQGSAGTGLATDTKFRLNLHELIYYKVDDDNGLSGETGCLVATKACMEVWQNLHAADPLKYVNVWVSSTGLSGGRVDHMPWDTREPGGEANPHWGWILNWDVFPIPGSPDTYQNHNTGDTMAHEFGHFLGLRHTFAGGCNSGVGDYIADTPAEKVPWKSTCRNNKVKVNGQWKVRNSCTARAGNDDVSNIMDYSYDTCRDHFTAGQAAAMQEILQEYRPLLYANTRAANTTTASPVTTPTKTPTTESPIVGTRAPTTPTDLVMTVSPTFLRLNTRSPTTTADDDAGGDNVPVIVASVVAVVVIATIAGVLIYVYTPCVKGSKYKKIQK